MANYKRCKHKWKDMGRVYFRNYPIYWCSECGAININDKTKSPKFYLENNKQEKE